MPYIKQEYRETAMDTPASVGQLNYAMTVRAIAFVEGRVTASEFGTYLMMLVENYLEVVGRTYQSFNDVMGVLACVPRELERRLREDFGAPNRVRRFKEEVLAMSDIFYVLSVAPYEDGKIEDNGDVFPKDMVTQIEEVA